MGGNLAGKGDGAGWETSVSSGHAPPPPRTRERLGRAAGPHNNRVQLPGPRGGRLERSSPPALPGEPGGWMSGDLAHPTFSEVLRRPSSESPNGRRWRPNRSGTPTYPPSPSYRRPMPLLAPPAPPQLRSPRLSRRWPPSRPPRTHPPDTVGKTVPRREDLKRPRGHGQSLAGTRGTDVPSAACPEVVHLANRGLRG